jgi:hypothetical protein
MDRVAFGLAQPAYGWVTDAARADRRPIAPTLVSSIFPCPGIAPGR